MGQEEINAEINKLYQEAVDMMPLDDREMLKESMTDLAALFERYPVVCRAFSVKMSVKMVESGLMRWK